jgi:glycosyltransferase involved in cell wall biosynthesis
MIISTNSQPPRLCEEPVPGPHITHLTASIRRDGGGLATVVRSLTENMARKQTAEFEVLSATRERLQAGDLNGVRYHEFKLRGPASVGFAAGIGAHLRHAAPDLIHVHGLWSYPSLVALNRSRAGIPYVVSPHGMLDRWALSNSGGKKRLAGWLFENRHLNRSACIHALCESEADSIRAYGLSNPICIIPNGVDVPASTEAGPAPWSQATKPDRNVLLFLGRIHPKKGLSNLLSAWASLNQTRELNEWDLVIAGWNQGSHQQALELQRQRQGIVNSVHFIGPQFGENKHACYANCSAAVLPSYSEGFPMAVLEPWAYAKPVLMTSECNVPEGFAANAALKIETSPESIAEGLRKLISLSKTDRQEIGTNGRHLVDDQFNWGAVARQMTSVYSWLLNDGPLPECVTLD